MAMLDDFFRLVARVCLAGLFVYEGAMILGNYPGAVAYATLNGVPAYLVPAAVAVQLVGGILVVLGWGTRIAALALAGFCFATAFIFHNNFASADAAIQFGKDVGLAGGFLLLFATGPGRFALHHAPEKRW